MMEAPVSRLTPLFELPLAAHAATAIVLVGCLVAVARARAHLGARRGGGPRRVIGGEPRDGGEVARVLEARGLASPEALRGMSARERQFLLEQAAPAMGPRSVLRTPSSGPAVVRSPRATPASRTPSLTITSAGAPPLRRVHCPACGAAFGPGATAPVVAPCPRCGRRVSAHLEGSRLVVTVEDDSGRPRRRP